MTKPFDYLNSISYKKNYLIEDEQSEKDYPAFLVNRGLSYFPDTILYANEMNMRTHIDNKLAYDYLINIVRPRRRFSKWHKAKNYDEVNVIQEYYKCSETKALEYKRILSSDQISALQKKLLKGNNERHSRKNDRDQTS
jgi:hypothetical protein